MNAKMRRCVGALRLGVLFWEGDKIAASEASRLSTTHLTWRLTRLCDADHVRE